MQKLSLPPIALLLDSSRGTYIPEHFVTNFDLSKWQGIDADDILLLKLGQEAEGYWDAWQSVLDNATFTEHGHVWRLYQDGDLWAYCPALMSEEEKHNFGIDGEMI